MGSATARLAVLQQAMPLSSQELHLLHSYAKGSGYSGHGYGYGGKGAAAHSRSSRISTNQRVRAWRLPLLFALVVTSPSLVHFTGFRIDPASPQSNRSRIHSVQRSPYFHHIFTLSLPVRVLATVVSSPHTCTVRPVLLPPMCSSALVDNNIMWSVCLLVLGMHGV